MNLRRNGWLFCCGMATSAWAGTPPPCYVMTPGPSATQYAWLDPGSRGVLVNMVLADAADYSNIDQNPATGWLPGGAMAHVVADRILMRRSANYPQNSLDPQGAPLPDHRICICFTKFGVDNAV